MLSWHRSSNSVRNMIFWQNQRFGLLWGLTYRLSLVNVCLRWVAGILQNSSRNECESLPVMKGTMKIVILLRHLSVFFSFSNGTILANNIRRLVLRISILFFSNGTILVMNIKHKSAHYLFSSSKVEWQEPFQRSSFVTKLRRILLVFPNYFHYWLKMVTK